MKPSKLALLPFLFVPALVACSDDDDDGAAVTTIGASLGALGLNTLDTAVKAAELDDDLSGPGPFTLFGPTDAAFAALPSGVLDDLLDPLNQAVLSDLLLYHAVSGSVDSTTAAGLSAATSLQGSSLIVDSVGGELYLDDARVVGADFLADNGIVHKIDRVLTPPTDLTSTLVARGFTTLVSALEDTGLDAALAGPGPFTILAPTDAAFAALPAGFLAGLTLQELTEVLQYHVIAGRVRASEALAGGLAETLLGPSAVFALEGDTARVNGVALTSFNVPATNGVIHVLDAVLLPPDLPTLAANAGFDTLVAALVAAGLDDDLAAPNGPFTVFAPTEEAFAAVPSADLAALLEPANQAALQQLLLYHVVSGALDSGDVLAAATLTTLEGSDLAVTVTPPTVGGADLVALDVGATNGIVHAVDAVLVPPGFIFPVSAERGPRAQVTEGAAPRFADDGIDPMQALRVAGWKADGAELEGGSLDGVRLVRNPSGALRLDLDAQANAERVLVRLTGEGLDGLVAELVPAPGGLPLELSPERVSRTGDGAWLLAWSLPERLRAPELDLVLVPGRGARIDSLQVGLR